jgi:hypothetical protein
MMRHFGKRGLTIALWLLLAAPTWADSLVTTVVTDPLSGVAIDGYDAVSYFTDPEPQPGKPDFEYDWQGVPWYFEKAANRDVFMRNPEVYAPQFGGYCVTSLSRGYLSDGKPRLYLVRALKLYFFYSTANRDAFQLSPEEALKAAVANWPKLLPGLVGPGATGSAAASSAEPPAPDTEAPSVAPLGPAANVGASDSSSGESASHG